MIVGAARTPFSRFGGTLRDVTLPDLGSRVVVAALERGNVAPANVDELCFGVNLPGSDRSIARQVQLRSGIPPGRVAFTVDRACCSALAAISLMRCSIRLGEASVCVAGGVENLSRVPYFLEHSRWGHRLGDITLTDQLVISCPHTGVPRAVQAGEEAVEHGIGRDEQDEWALRSQRRFADAQAAGKIASEIVPIELSTRDGDAVLDADEGPRPDTTLESLSRLSTVNGSPTVTAGNAPGLSTGAAAMVLTTPEHAKTFGATVLAKIRESAMVSGEPAKIASIPAVAALKVLEKARLRLDDLALIEINEAFAAVPLVTTLVLAEGDRRRALRLREITNVNGGSVAIGHPTGASGARLVMTIAAELQRRGGGIGLVTMCGGIGEAQAMLVEVA